MNEQLFFTTPLNSELHKYYYEFQARKLFEYCYPKRVELICSDKPDLQTIAKTLGIEVAEAILTQDAIVSGEFTKYEFGEETIKSYAGYYGWMEYPGGNGYYRLFYGCYFAIAILWTVSILKSKRDVGSYLYLIAVNSIIAILFGASVWHSWTGDFQPQGRYLLPMNAVCAADAIEVQSESKQKKWAGTIQVILIILGVYSFVKYGIVMLT